MFSLYSYLKLILYFLLAALILTKVSSSIYWLILLLNTPYTLASNTPSQLVGRTIEVW